MYFRFTASIYCCFTASPIHISRFCPAAFSLCIPLTQKSFHMSTNRQRMMSGPSKDNNCVLGTAFQNFQTSRIRRNRTSGSSAANQITLNRTLYSQHRLGGWINRRSRCNKSFLSEFLKILLGDVLTLTCTCL